MIQELTEKSLVVQHNQIVEARYRLSLGEQRLIRVLVSLIEPQDEDFKNYQLRVADIAKLLGITHGDFYRGISLITKKLISSPITIHTEDKIIQMAWLAQAEYVRSAGYVELAFAPKLKPFLLQLKKHFTAYELANIARMQSAYSIRIYELCKQYERIGKRRILVQELREMLGITERQYKLFGDFKRRVLAQAKEDIDKKADISIEFTEIKNGRKCEAIEFTIIAKEKERRDVAALADERQEGEILLVGLGVAAKTARVLSRKYDGSYIKEKVALAKKKEGEITNVAGFIVSAIKENWQESDIERRKQQEREKQAREAHARKVRDEYSSFCKMYTFEEYKKLGREEQERMKREFLDGRTGVIAEIYRKKKDFGFEDGMFRAYVMSILKAPPFEVWAKEKGLAADVLSGAGMVAAGSS